MSIKNKIHIKSKNGMTLLEVLIIVTLLTLVMLGVAQLISMSLKGAKLNQEKILATRYADELQEWLRGEKEAEWSTFAGKASETGRTYCFNNVSLSWPSIGNCNNVYGLYDMYKREVILTSSEDASGDVVKVELQINVNWNNGGNEYSIPIDSVLTPWE